MPNIIGYGRRRMGKSTLALALAVEAHRRVVVWDPNGQFPKFQSIEGSIADYYKDTAGGYYFGRVGPFNRDEIEERFSEFAESVVELRDISVIIDESHLLQESNSMHPALDRLTRRCPSSVLVIQTTHRVVNANPDSRYFADDIFFFHSYTELELKTIQKDYGREVALLVNGLKRHQVVHFWRDELPHWEVWEDGAIWFVDLGNENQ